MTDKWEQIRIDAWHRMIKHEEQELRKWEFELKERKRSVSNIESIIERGKRHIEGYKADLKEQEKLK